jgi:hypothetical protein
MVETFDLIIHNGTYVMPPGRGCVQACKAGLWMSSDPEPTQIHHRGCPVQTLVLVILNHVHEGYLTL